MTKQELVGIYAKLDKGKFKLLEKGVSFQLIIHDKGDFLNTGIGTGESMSIMNLYNLVSLYAFGAKEDATIEEYAESIKQSIIKAYTEDAFHMKENRS